MDEQARESLRKRLAMFIFKAAPGAKPRPPNEDDDVEMIHSAVFPDLWDDVPPERRRLPYHHVATFRPNVEVYELAFLSAPAVEVPCRGTPELLGAVEEIHRALAAGDKQKLVDLMSLQIEELAMSLEGNGPTVLQQIEAYDEFFAEPIDVLPLDGAKLHFTSRAGGRVVEVTRIDDQPVIAAVTKSGSFSHASNPLFTQVDGRWRLM
jgi:hypothetical protein